MHRQKELSIFCHVLSFSNAHNRHIFLKCDLIRTIKYLSRYKSHSHNHNMLSGCRNPCHPSLWISDFSSIFKLHWENDKRNYKEHKGRKTREPMVLSRSSIDWLLWIDFWNLICKIESDIRGYGKPSSTTNLWISNDSY